jgi:lysophospholipase L1-like esterase
VPRRSAVLAIASVAAALACVLPAFGASNAMKDAADTQAAPGKYYLALGDSLASGDQPDHTGKTVPTNQGYVNRLAAMLAAHGKALTIRNLGCGGETTSTMIHGSFCSYPDEPAMSGQLQAAVDFLHAHAGQVPLITIDIGGNDLDSCTAIASATAAAACVKPLLAGMNPRLTTIMKALRAADPAAVIVGLNYYVPELANWFGGAAGRSMAAVQVKVTESLNAALAAGYKPVHALNANVFAKFKSTDLTGKTALPGHGIVPVNVALICDWTWMCAAKPKAWNAHANRKGYGHIAAAIYAVLPASIAG